MLWCNVSTEAQDEHIQILALERAFHIFMAPDGHPRFSYLLGMRKVFSWLQSAASPLDVTKSNTLYLELALQVKDVLMIRFVRYSKVDCL